MRFDTLDKKPKLYILIPLTVIAAGVVAALCLTGAQEHSIAICSVSLAYLVLADITLVRAFIRQLRYNPYSYNTIYYIGFALFVFSIIVTDAVLLARIINAPDEYPVSTLLHMFVNSASNYMLYSAPFILGFSAALFVSNVSLLRHERKRFANVLGMLLSALMVLGWVLIFALDYYASGSQFQVMMHDLAVNTLSGIYLYVECMLIGVIIANIICTRYEPEKDKDFIIILGCGLKKDGTPTNLLKGRIDRALLFSEKQKAETGREPIFVTSGGRGPDEVNSESFAMKNYLLEHGVPEERIIEEDRSKDTFENMKFSKDKIMAADPGAKIAFATTNYHVFRSGLFARRVKMRAVGMGAKTKWYFWPNAAVREFVGLLSSHRLKQGIVLGSIIAFYVILTLVIYR